MIRIDGRARRGAPFAAIVTAIALAGAPGLSAQGHQVSLGGTINAGDAVVSPRSGSAGSVFKLTPHGLPANTAVQVMMGALRSGFEIVQTSMTDEMGRIGGQDTVRVTVPDWVLLDRAYLVMVTDVNYNPLASADMFHPTDPSGHVTRRGTIKWEDPTCATLTADGGEMYILTGDTHTLSSGTEMVVAGTVVPPGRCGPMTTIELTHVKPTP